MTYTDSKETVEKFLIKVRNILTDRNFNIKNNFYILKLRKNYSANNKYTNLSTMAELEYEEKDVLNEILSLTIEHYKETWLDNQPGKIHPFYCFIKEISNKQVYIKFKISEEKNKQVFCVSFHFSERNVELSELPYKEN